MKRRKYMPFDIPTHLDYDVDFEPTKMNDKKYGCLHWDQ